MRKPGNLALFLTSMLFAACQSGAPSAAPTGVPTALPTAAATSKASLSPTATAQVTVQPTIPDTPLPTEPVTPPPPTSGGFLVLKGSFTAHNDDPENTTDATFDVVVHWNRPNDIQDRLNFQFASGSYTFSTSVPGVCGGNRSEGGPLALWGSDAQALILGDPQDRSQTVNGQLIDRRVNQGGLAFAFVASFPIPNAAAECQPPYNDTGNVDTCTMEFLLATLDTLQPDATCTLRDTTWKGHLTQQ